MADDLTATSAWRASERSRLQQLWAYNILDTPPEPQFDELVEFASTLCRARGAAIGLVDAQRVWFKARVGSSLIEVNREGSFCDVVVATKQPLIVRNAQLDPRFAANAHVRAGQALRAYAGFPLTLPSGAILGSFCVIDVKPRDWTAAELAAVRILAQQVVMRLELHKAHADVARLWEQNHELETRCYAAAQDVQRRVTAELQDGLGQELAGISFLAAAALAHCHDARIAADLREIELLLRAAVQSCGRLARGHYAFGLMPLSLREALGHHLDTVNDTGAMRCTLEWPGTIELRDRHVAYNLFRIAEDAITNALQGSGGSSVVVRVQRHGERLCLEIEDDGRSAPALPAAANGLRTQTMHYRAKSIGGQLDVHARLPHGQIVRCAVPLASRGDGAAGDR